MHNPRQPDILLPTLEEEGRQKRLQIRWPHAPVHQLSEKGVFMVTAGTLHKRHYFAKESELDFLHGMLLSLASGHSWQLEAWSVFSNHYHFIARSPDDPGGLSKFLTQLHSETARQLNRSCGLAGRKIWHNYWESKLTHHTSYLARLNYVHQNAVLHGLVRIANAYRWCSAGWFENTASPAMVKTIYGFKTDRLNVFDPF